MPTSRTDKRATYEDLLEVPDHKVAEIVDAELFVSPRPVTPSPETGHQSVAVRLVVLLKNFLDAHPLGNVYVAPLDVS